MIGNAPKGSVRHRWEQLANKRGDLLTRCEQYSAWTIPNVFPEEHFSENNTQLSLSNDSIGARGVNNMANKVVSTLFRPQGSFFRLSIDPTQQEQLDAMSQDSKGADTGAALNQVEKVLTRQEQKAMDRLEMVQFRDKAVMIAKLLLVTGNALHYQPEDGPSQAYSLRDYVVQRDISGVVIEIITRDTKAFETFSPEVQAHLRSTRQYSGDQYDDDTQVTIYTQVRLEDDGKYHVKQAADLVDLHISDQMVSYPRKKLPWIPLTWNLARGNDYGSGLVEEYAGAFHSVEVLTQSLLNLAGVMGDIKYLVNPSSLIDVATLNNSPSGSYHSGKKDDVSAIEHEKQRDAQFMATMIDRYTQQLSQAFLLNSSMVRDAERVTAEEIRMVANELEASHGGVYSRLAHQWQLPLSYVILDQINWDGEFYGIEPKIITGMDTLSRIGEMDNIKLWIMDMAGLEAIPEDIRRVINPLKFAEYSGRNRQVPWEQLTYTDDELTAQAERDMANQQRLMEMQSNANVAQKAGEAAVTTE